MILAKDYVDTMPRNQDYVALALAFRKAGCELAEAASLAIREWDGHHRLCIAVSEWYKTISDERSHLK